MDKWVEATETDIDILIEKIDAFLAGAAEREEIYFQLKDEYKEKVRGFVRNFLLILQAVED